VEVFEHGMADAALAASIFHYNEIPVHELKDYLKKANITIR
jgi:cyclase